MSSITVVRRALVVLNLGTTPERRLGRSKQIVQAGTGNAWIPTLSPPIPQVTSDVEAFDTQSVLAKDRGAGAVAARLLKDNVVKADMESWAWIVQKTADANPASAKAIIESMSMFVKGVSVREQVPLVIEVGTQPGTVTAIAKAGPKGVRVFYEYQYMLTAGQAWLAGGLSTDHTIVITGLPSLTWVGFRYRITHKNVPGAWSQTVNALVH
jgi:hypothetical protein